MQAPSNQLRGRDCFDIPLALAFSYVSIKGRNKSDFASQRWSFKYSGVPTPMKKHEFSCPACSMDVYLTTYALACCSPWGCKELDMTEQLN